MSRGVTLSTSPLLASRTPVWRSKLIVAAIALSFVGLAARAAYVQVLDNKFFQDKGKARFERTLDLPPNRGRILDRNGLILASSIPASGVWAVPDEVERDKAKLTQLAKLLGLTPAELNQKLADEDKNFVWLKRQVDEAVAQQVEALGVRGVFKRKEYKRQYPEGDALAPVLGMTNIDDNGIAGVELTFNQQLSGTKGSRNVIKDRLGRVVEVRGDDIAPQDGKDVQLSIDSKVQYFAYEKLKSAVQDNQAKGGSVVVLDSTTGEVLALANYTTPPGGKRPFPSAVQFRNRALSDSFEPGSTMKPFTIALALEKGLVKPETMFQTAPGKITVGGSTVGDAHPLGMLSVNQIIQKSSNVGTVKIAMQMQPREMWEMFTRVGFGHKPDIPFPGAVRGMLRPAKSWRPIEQATMAYGYGLSVSLFQLAQAYSVFARDGEFLPVSLVKTDQPAAGVRVLTPEHAAQVRHMLHLVTGEGGTAPKAQTVGYSVGGKTGTAHKQEGKGYAEKKYRGWFVGIAPIERPRIVVAVMIDEPSAGKYYGGDVAAPVFSETVAQSLRLLGVQPDMSVKPQIVAHAVEESFQ